ncbi:MAG: SH3 domain-containing protein [Anaerolineaceae bacterium]|nr:SH3 domain-containing protein [Anaerolineaceae bacterium]
MKLWFRIALALVLLASALAAGPLTAQEEGAELMAVVATSRLNVRDTPVFLLGRVLTQIDRGESYPVVGRNLEGTWAQLDIDGETGWVNARYIIAPGLQDAPFSASAAAAGIINARVRTGRLNVRDFPHHQYGLVLTQVFNNSIWSVTGRNEDSTWVQLDVDGSSGWVNVRYLLAPDLLAAPELETDPEALPVNAQIDTGRLNARDVPNFLAGEVVTRLWRGEIYPVVGRNLDSTWAQLDIDGTPGWVNARYIDAPRLELAPLSVEAAAADDAIFAQVNTGRLNVRDFPHHQYGFVLTQIFNNSFWPVTGRNMDSSWAQLDIDGEAGWVNARYLLAPDLDLAPLLEPDPAELPVSARVNTGRVNARDIPHFFGGEIVTKLWRGEEYPVLARNFDSSWAQLDIDGESAWVNARYLVAPRLDLALPAADAFAAEGALFAMVDTGRLNVRDLPIVPEGEILTQLTRGHVVAVLGRDEQGGWLQVDHDFRGEGAVGWVNARYMNAPDVDLAPVTLYG